MTPIFLFYYYIVSILSNQDDSLQITICSTDTFIFCSLSYNYSINNNITTLYYFFNNSNKQTTFFKLCFYFSHHLTEQESKQSFSSIQSNPFSFPSLYHCLFVLKINNKTNLKHRHNIKPNHMNNSLSLISKTVFNNRFTGSFVLIIRQIQRSLK